MIASKKVLPKRREHKALEVVEALSEKGIKSSIVGELTEPAKAMVLVSEGAGKNSITP